MELRVVNRAIFEHVVGAGERFAHESGHSPIHCRSGHILSPAKSAIIEVRQDEAGHIGCEVNAVVAANGDVGTYANNDWLRANGHDRVSRYWLSGLDRI